MPGDEDESTTTRTACPDRCGWKRVQSTRFGKPHQNARQQSGDLSLARFSRANSMDASSVSAIS
jgi:hypothetical protein